MNQTNEAQSLSNATIESAIACYIDNQKVRLDLANAGFDTQREVPTLWLGEGESARLIVRDFSHDGTKYQVTVASQSSTGASQSWVRFSDGMHFDGAPEPGGVELRLSLQVSATATTGSGQAATPGGIESLSIRRRGHG